jgi:23S rRNA (cytidine1920-2'-O)/16S rRNA (cytidine1409-2'-O)-methyltransferase
VRDPAAHQAAIERVRRCVEGLRGSDIEVIDSPILGAEGNREFLMFFSMEPTTSVAQNPVH